jgi:hypothetical protein
MYSDDIGKLKVKKHVLGCASPVISAVERPTPQPLLDRLQMQKAQRVPAGECGRPGHAK